MHKWHYYYAGLRVSSQLNLPEWEPFLHSGEDGVPDVVIRVDMERSVALLEPGVSADEYRFCMPDVGAYRITKGKEIIVTPESKAGQNELRLFLLGTAWGALCYQRRLFAVHASSVQVGDQAVLFCAFPGKGKSTMTAWLAAHGHALISDDLCCINFTSHDQPAIYPSTQRLRLWSDALEALGWDSSQLERDHYRFDKFLLPWTGASVRSTLPLRAVYLLEWGEFRLERLTGMNAMQRFVGAATYRGELINMMGLEGTYWQWCLELLQKVPVWELSRPKDLTRFPATVEMLERHWTSHSGLTLSN